MIDFTLIIYLTKENLATFPESLASVLNQTTGLSDLFIVSKIQEANFDIRTVNTKIIKGDIHAPELFREILSKSFSNHLVLFNNPNSKIILDNDFCKLLRKEHATFQQYPLVSAGKIDGKTDMLVINKELLDQQKFDTNWLDKTAASHLPFISSHGYSINPL
ncbi:MAG: hypothetical protein ACLFQM_02440 [Fidelibacterota bacterium]